MVSFGESMVDEEIRSIDLDRTMLFQDSIPRPSPKSFHIAIIIRHVQVDTQTSGQLNLVESIQIVGPKHLT